METKAATMISDTQMKAWVDSARGGDSDALNTLIENIQGLVYKLALKMLGQPDDARDASQEILIKVVTGLADFRSDSLFTTWVYRLASNHLLSTLRRPSLPLVRFDVLAEQIEAGMAVAERFAHPAADDILVAQEMMAACTQKMLLGLDSAARIAYVLGDICEISGEQAAEILDITPVTFRQRLSRARRELSVFMQPRCGVVDAANVCRCAKQVGPAIAMRKLDPLRPVFAVQPQPADAPPQAPHALQAAIGELESIARIARVLRAAQCGPAPSGLVPALRALIATRQYRILS
jgi:RNA polymerase sigma factor (sigma-70 family)